MRIITSPTVQLGLDLQYPALRLIQGVLQLVGVHRRPPDIPVRQPLTCWPPSPCGRLSRPPRRAVTPATTTGPPPHPQPSAGNGPAHRRAGCPAARAAADGSHVHHASIGQGGAQLYSGSLATPTPQAFSVASPPEQEPGFGVDPPPAGRPG